MIERKLLKTENGFTMVEIIAVLVILGLLAAVAVTKYIDLEKNAKQKTFSTVVNEINAREFLTWSDAKISTSGYVNDAQIFGKMDYNVDPNYAWNPGDPTVTGGTLVFKGDSFSLSRSASTIEIPAIWTQR